MASDWQRITANDGGANFDWANPRRGLLSKLAFEEMRLVINDRAKCFENVDEILDTAGEFTELHHLEKFVIIKTSLFKLLQHSADFSLFSDNIGSLSSGEDLSTYDNYRGISSNPPAVRSTAATWDYVGTLISEDLDFWKLAGSSNFRGKCLHKDLLGEFYKIVGLVKYAVFFQDYSFNPQDSGRRGLVRGTSAMRYKSWWGQYYHQLNHFDTCELSENPSFADMYANYPAAPTYTTTTVTMASWCERESRMEQFPGPQGFESQYQGYSRYGDARALLPAALSGLAVSAFNLISDYGSLGFEGFGIVNEGFNTMAASTAGNVITVPIPVNPGSAFYQHPCRTDITSGGIKNDYVSYYAEAWAFVGEIDNATYLDYYTP